VRIHATHPLEFGGSRPDDVGVDWPAFLKALDPAFDLIGPIDIDAADLRSSISSGSWIGFVRIAGRPARFKPPS